MLLTGREKGFVLLELLIVLILITITSAIILPSFDTLMNSVEGKTVQRKVIKLFQQVRGRAITSNSIQTVTIVDNSLVYQMKEGKFELKKGIEKISIKDDQDNEIRFFPDGTSSGADLLFLTRNKRSFQIIIDPVTGRAESGGR